MNTPGVTFGTPSGAVGGAYPFNRGRLSPQSSPPTIQLVTTNPAPTPKETFTHDEIVEVYESFKALRSQMLRWISSNSILTSTSNSKI